MLSLKLKGRWEGVQLSDELQRIIVKHLDYTYFDGKPVYDAATEIDDKSTWFLL